MKTIRLTMAQALVRYLCAQRTAIDGQDQPLFAGVFAHLRPWQRHLPVARRWRRSRTAADLARAERAVDGAGRRSASPRRSRRRQIMVATSLDRAGRDQHGDRGGGGPCQPPAGAAAGRRHLRQPDSRSGAAAGRAFRRSDHDRERCLQGGDPLLGPHRPAGADPAARCRRRSPPCWTRPTAARPSSPSARTRRARPIDYPERFFEPQQHRDPRASGPTGARSPRPLALLRQAKRPLILAGGGVHYSLAAGERSPPSPPTHRIPVAETIAGRGVLLHEHPHECRAARASSAPPRPMRWPPRPMSCSPSARGCRISPPAPGPCSRRPMSSSSRSMPRASMR